MGSNLANLPTEILLEILSRLPTETALECKLVCKPWSNLVCNPSFSQMHLTRLNLASKLSFLTLIPSRNIENQQYHYFEYNENRITKIKMNPPFLNDSIIGSCNGLICLNACQDDTSFDHQPAYVCNPITREYVMFPMFKDTARDHDEYYVFSGFGYVRETNEYKVVRIKQVVGEDNFESVEVYTLGSGNGWRNIGECGLSFSVGYFVNDYGVFAGETLHWATLEGKVVAFNLAEEKFYELPMPCPSLARDSDLFFKLGVLGGVKKYWNQNMTEQEELSLDNVKPLALMKSGGLLCYSHTGLYSYDRNSNHVRHLVKFRQFISPPVAHMNTLISLKAGNKVQKQWNNVQYHLRR